MADETTKPAKASIADQLRKKLEKHVDVAVDAGQMSVTGADPELAYRIIDLTGRGDQVALARARWAAEGWTKLSDLRPVHETVVGVPLAELWVMPGDYLDEQVEKKLKAAIEDPSRTYILIAEGNPATSPQVQRMIQLHNQALRNRNRN